MKKKFKIKITYFSNGLFKINKIMDPSRIHQKIN